ncbi:unnamed protein product [Bursaphelenchus okinawaensis]|uniref:HAT C-terminal dimerisation domain-containing protein n=1 Tax=Bursaphelenchus okinawaensis TaxID=465554 RepID=A0A811LKR4_9BILA|nr:unnamed protein product [Bursaphelenchus okinawaensis]CAG9123519.1 unnamed protein product [Bursaphelenchus okinawaensis]
MIKMDKDSDEVEGTNASDNRTKKRQNDSGSSTIWKVFNAKKECLINGCSYVSKDKTSSTKAMWDHVRCKHNETFTKLKEQCNSHDELPTKKQCSISNYLVKRRNHDFQTSRDNHLVKTILSMRCALRHLDSDFLHVMADSHFPNTKKYGKGHFTDIVIPRMVADINSLIRTTIGKGKFTITSDGWSSGERSFQCLTLHTVDQQYKRKNFVIGCKSFGTDVKIGANIAEKVLEICEDYGFAKNQILCMVRDDAANMKKASKIIDVKSFQCVCHLLNLVVSQAINASTGSVSEVVAKAREFEKLSRQFENKNKFKEAHERLNVPFTKIPREIVTRWNSTYMMLQSLLAKFHVVITMKYNKFLQKDQNQLLVIVKILKKFHELTVMFSEDDATASAVLPLLNGLADYFQLTHEKLKTQEEFKDVVNFIEDLWERLTTRMENIQNKEIMISAQLIDPRYSHQLSANTAKIGVSYINKMLKAGVDNATEENEPNLDDLEEESQSSLDLSFLDDDLITTRQKHVYVSSTQEETIQREYNDLRTCGHDDNPYKFWEKNEKRFSTLAVVARELLSVPPSSVPSERFFSHTTMLFADHLKSRLSNEMAEEILLLRCQLIQQKDVNSEIFRF